MTINLITAGTPSESTWPGVSSLQDYKSTFPKWKPQNLKNIFLDKLDDAGLDLIQVKTSIVTIIINIHHVNLLQKMLVYCPPKRLSAMQCLKHHYFKV